MRSRFSHFERGLSDVLGSIRADDVGLRVDGDLRILVNGGKRGIHQKRLLIRGA